MLRVGKPGKLIQTFHAYFLSQKQKYCPLLSTSVSKTLLPTMVCALSRKCCSLENKLNQLQSLPQQKLVPLPEDATFCQLLIILDLHVFRPIDSIDSINIHPLNPSIFLDCYFSSLIQIEQNSNNINNKSPLA